MGLLTTRLFAPHFRTEKCDILKSTAHDSKGLVL